MYLLLTHLVLLFCGLAGSVAFRKKAFCSRFAAGCVLLSALCGIAGAAQVLLGNPVLLGLPLFLPMGQALVQADGTAAIFLLPVCIIGGLAALLLPGERLTQTPTVQPWRYCFFFCLLMAGMSLVILAADAVFFLLVWEIMSISPYFLLAPHDSNERERSSGWTYLVAAHIGALPLFLLFALLSANLNTTSFPEIALALGQGLGPQGLSGVCFVLALTGFGAKLGLFPMHVWMPEAYPHAPAPAAMVISGAMVNIGAYGLLRVLSMLPDGELWWAHSLLVVGGISGVAGIFFATVERDIKRVLAFSSCENMGIFCLGLGGALLASAGGATVAAGFFFLGALLHLWNHSLYKSLLFLGAELVRKATGLTDMNKLGGLGNHLPLIGVCMAAGCAAIAGLPPFNGFMGEFLLYMGFTSGAMATAPHDTTLAFWLGLFVLGGIGGFSLFCFTRLYGMTFAGAPRSIAATMCSPAHISRMETTVLSVLALVCVMASFSAPLLCTVLFTATQSHFPHLLALSAGSLAPASLHFPAIAAIVFCLLFALLMVWKKRVVLKNGLRNSCTWDCGYVSPNARVQYTGGSFSHSVIQVSSMVVRGKIAKPVFDSIFAKPASASIRTPDWLFDLFGTVFFQSVSAFAERCKQIQHGLLNSYILYILVALLSALVWALEHTP